MCTLIEDSTSFQTYRRQKSDRSVEVMNCDSHLKGHSRPSMHQRKYEELMDPKTRATEQRKLSSALMKRGLARSSVDETDSCSAAGKAAAGDCKTVPSGFGSATAGKVSLTRVLGEMMVVAVGRFCERFARSTSRVRQPKSSTSSAAAGSSGPMLWGTGSAESFRLTELIFAVTRACNLTNHCKLRIPRGLG